MKIFYGILAAIAIIVVAYFILFPTDLGAKDINTSILVGQKFSELQGLSLVYFKSKSAGDRLTYTYYLENKNFVQIAVKDDIIEVVEVYNVCSSPGESINLFTELSIYFTVDEKCHLLRAYNTTMEFSKGNVIIRIEQIPIEAGWLVKYTAFAQ